MLALIDLQQLLQQFAVVTFRRVEGRAGGHGSAARDKGFGKALFRIDPGAHRRAALGKLSEKLQMLMQAGVALG